MTIYLTPEQLPSIKLKFIQSPGISEQLRTLNLDNENTLDSTTDGIISLKFKNWNNDKNENPNHAIQKLLDSLFAESSSEYKEQLRTFLQSLNQNKSNSESESLTFYAYHICRAKENLERIHAHEINRILEGLENYLIVENGCLHVTNISHQEFSKDYFINYMIANKNDFFTGFRNDMSHLDNHIITKFKDTKTIEFNDLKFWYLTQKSASDWDFDSFKERARTHAFFQPYFIHDSDYIEAKSECDNEIRKNLEEIRKVHVDSIQSTENNFTRSQRNNQQKEVIKKSKDQIIKIFEANKDIYYTTLEGPDEGYNQNYFKIFLAQKMVHLENYLNLDQTDKDKSYFYFKFLATVHEWVHSFQNMGEMLEYKCSYKLAAIMKTIHKYLKSKEVTEEEKTKFHDAIKSITNFQLDIEQTPERIFGKSPRFLTPLSKKIKREALNKLRSPNGGGRDYWDAHVSQLLQFIYQKLKHNEETFSDSLVCDELKISKNSPIALRKIQLTLWFMEQFPKLLPRLYEVKSKYRYDDLESGKTLIYHDSTAADVKEEAWKSPTMNESQYENNLKENSKRCINSYNYEKGFPGVKGFDTDSGFDEDTKKPNKRKISSGKKQSNKRKKSQSSVISDDRYDITVEKSLSFQDRRIIKSIAGEHFAESVL